MRRSAALLGITLASGLLLAACGAEEGIPEGGTDRGQDEDETPHPTQPPAIALDEDERPYDCFDISPVEPGRYQVGEAGTVEITVDDGEFEVEDVEPSDGWEHEVEQDEGLVVEVRFHREGAEDDDDHPTRAYDPGANRGDPTPDVLTLVVTQGPSADDVDPMAEICTTLQ